jgi:hypothetical protein
MQPTAYQPAVDQIAYNGQQIMVVGCGTMPMTHPGQPHLVPQGNMNTGANIAIGLAAAYTMDISAAMTPHRVGSFWIADHTEDLPSNAFGVIYFENLPGNLFANRGWSLTAVRSAHRLLMAGGHVLIRSGLNTVDPGSELDGALQTVFGINNVRYNIDVYNVALDIRATK